MRTKIILLILITLLSILFVSGGYFISIFDRSKSGFDRVISNDIFHSLDSVGLDPSTYLAGVSTDGIYLGNYSTRQLSLFSFTLDHSQEVPIHVDGFHNPVYKILSPFYLINEAGRDKIGIGHLNKNHTTELLNESAFVVDFIPFDSTSILLKTWNVDHTEFSLSKAGRDGIELHPEILEKQLDGKFCTDGITLLNNELPVIIYTYYYRNEFIVIDTALRVIHRVHTIDTISQARISIGSIESENSISLASPARVVNNLVATAGSFLFIQSLIKADNEDSNDFRTHDVVDIYHLPDGTYWKSFYLPKIHGEGIEEFTIFRNRIFVRYKHFLLSGTLFITWDL